MPLIIILIIVSIIVIITLENIIIECIKMYHDRQGFKRARIMIE